MVRIRTEAEVVMSSFSQSMEAASKVCPEIPFKDNFQISIDPSRLDPQAGKIIIRAKYNDNSTIAFGLPDKGIEVVVNRDKSLEEYQNLCALITELGPHLRPDEAEIDTSRLPRAPLIEPSQWKVWEYESSYECYENIIHPFMAARVREVLESFGGSRVGLADIFSGRGEFLTDLRRELGADLFTSMRISLVERDSQAILKARLRFEDDPNVAIIQQDIISSGQIFPGDEKPDIVTAMGGLCHRVISREAAFRVARGVYKQLAPNGVFLVTGLTPVLLNRKEFEAIGFKVKGMTNTITLPKNKVPPQIYHLVKDS